jgi:outer membrane usher protein
VRLGSSIAFADGHVGVGQPIRGGAFALVYPHESIADKEIAVGHGTGVRARANAFGPAVVPDLPAYIGSNLPVDVGDLPVGYSLGTGSFDLVPPYRGGFALEVGSAHSVSAFGTLMLGDFTPVALASGVAFPVDDPSQQVMVFTNRAGRFGAEGLAPGRWIIEVKLENETLRYELDVPEKTEGLLRAGILLPASGGGG